MTKRKPVRGSGPVIERFVDGQVSLGALAANAAISADFTADADEPLYMIDAKLSAGLRTHTVGEGPILVGIAHGSYSASDIEEWIESTSDLGTLSLKQQEITKRSIVFLGAVSGALVDEALNGGVPIHVKLGFPLADGEGLVIWAYNRDAAALTTGSVVSSSGLVRFRRM